MDNHRKSDMCTMIWYHLKSMRIIVAVVTILFLGTFFIVHDQPRAYSLGEREPVPVPAQLDPMVDEVSASAWALFDVANGEVLVGDNIVTKKPIASITKLFTAFVAFEAGMEEHSVLITPAMVATEGGAGKLHSGVTMSIRELVFPLLIESSNDAAVAIREGVGADFDTHVKNIIHDAHLMDTRIVDASGLDSKNVSTVTDMARWFSYIYKNNRHILDITQLPMYIGAHDGYVNNDPAIHTEGFIGGKQGFLDEARYTFVGAFLRSDGTSVGVALLGSENISEDINVLLDYYDAR